MLLCKNRTHNNGELTITDSTLEGNKAKKTGGAISDEVGILMDNDATPDLLIYGLPCKSVVKNKININNCQFIYNTPDNNNERPSRGGFKGDFIHRNNKLFFIKSDIY